MPSSSTVSTTRSRSRSRRSRCSRMSRSIFCSSAGRAGARRRARPRARALPPEHRLLDLPCDERRRRLPRSSLDLHALARHADEELQVALERAAAAASSIPLPTKWWISTTRARLAVAVDAAVALLEPVRSSTGSRSGRRDGSGSAGRCPRGGVGGEQDPDSGTGPAAAGTAP